MMILIVGPTASGKSALALEIAKNFQGEIINGDAFQIYQEFDIGTAKPTLKERSIVPHHLFDFVSPTEHFSPKEYQILAREKIEEIVKRNHLPIIVGGSGNYQKATLYDYQYEEYVDPDMSKYDNYTNEELYAELLKVDEEACKKIHPNNRKRVLRALMTYIGTGKRKSEIESEQEHIMLYDCLIIGIDMDRDLLYQKIDERVIEMIHQGLEKEARTLYQKYGKDIQPFQAIGYKEWIDYFENKSDKEAVILEIQKHSRNYAKRQMTYFRHQFDVRWFHSKEEAYHDIEEQLKGV